MIDNIIHDIMINNGLMNSQNYSYYKIACGCKSPNRLNSLIYKITSSNRKFILKIFSKNDIAIKVLNDIHEFVQNINLSKIIFCAPVIINRQSVFEYKNYLIEIYNYIDNDYNDKYQKTYNGYGEVTLQKLVSSMHIIAKLHNLSYGAKEVINTSIYKYENFNKRYLLTDKLFYECLMILNDMKYLFEEMSVDFSFFNKEYYDNIFKNIPDTKIMNIHGDMHFNNILYKNCKAVVLIDIHTITSDFFYYDISQLLYQACFHNKNGEITEFNLPLFNFLLKKYIDINKQDIDYEVLFNYIFCLIIIEFNKIYVKDREKIRFIIGYVNKYLL